MFDLASINPDDVSKGVQLAKEVSDAVDAKLPGVSYWLNDKAQISHARRMMDAVNTLRAHGDQIGLDGDITDAIVANTLRQMGGDENVAKCVLKALPGINEKTAFSELDEEKAEYWRMHAEKAKSEDMQELLGAILAGEVNKSGAVSKRTLSIVADMSKDDAVVFQKLCSVSLGGPSKIVPEYSMPPQLFMNKSDNCYCDGFLFLNEVNDMEALGLVRVGYHHQPTVGKGWRMVVCDEDVIVGGDNSDAKVVFSEVVFTKYGTELASLFKLGNHPGLKDEFRKTVESQGLRFTDGPAVETIIVKSKVIDQR